jgi:hypothetical protein
MARKARFGVVGKGHVLPELPTMLFTSEIHEMGLPDWPLGASPRCRECQL